MTLPKLTFWHSRGPVQASSPAPPVRRSLTKRRRFMPQASTGKETPTTQARDRHRVKRTLREETEKIHATVEVSEGELAVGGGRVGGQDQRQEERCPSCAFPHDLDSCRDYAEMDATGEWEFVKAGRLRAICFWKASHALGGSTLRQCSTCQGVHNGSLHCSIMP